MQTVSTAWETNQDKVETSKARCQVVYDIVDTDLADPIVTDNGHEAISDNTKIYGATLALSEE